MYTHFEYKSGANPYIAMTDKETKRILKKYEGKITEIKPGFYLIDDIIAEQSKGKLYL
jgi:hypothetical protein